MNKLLEELEKTKQTSAYGQNHLLDTIIARVKELNEDENKQSDIVIGF